MDQCEAGGEILLPHAIGNEEGEGFRFRDLYCWNATVINQLTVVPPLVVGMRHVEVRRILPTRV
jgi:hypothetical protein